VNHSQQDHFPPTEAGLIDYFAHCVVRAKVHSVVTPPDLPPGPLSATWSVERSSQGWHATIALAGSPNFMKGFSSHKNAFGFAKCICFMVNLELSMRHASWAEFRREAFDTIGEEC
jgi:hypothetical protein